ncbi:hypothetical protein [Amycolatopsis sp. H20-H5]|nr:hypothetical protein [Amycolatopsis sp. H20-H5]MEC3981944.1 hypothetical protein [Amycolatopsis sp. H20-H5]
MDGIPLAADVALPGWVSTVISVASAVFIAVILLLFFLRRRKDR